MSFCLLTGLRHSLRPTRFIIYIYGNLSEADVADILLGAQGYIASADGIPPWRERPVIFRKQCVARIPPQEIAP